MDRLYHRMYLDTDGYFSDSYALFTINADTGKDQ